MRHTIGECCWLAGLLIMVFTNPRNQYMFPAAEEKI
jgi:hypothetical protein